jgi:hypothetical protein
MTVIAPFAKPDRKVLCCYLQVVLVIFGVHTQ